MAPEKKWSSSYQRLYSYSWPWWGSTMVMSALPMPMSLGRCSARRSYTDRSAGVRSGSLAVMAWLLGSVGDGGWECDG